MGNRTRGRWVWVWLLLGGAACDDDTPSTTRASLSEGCSLNSDCSQEPSPLLCTFRRCHVQCKTSADCNDKATPDKYRCMLSDKPTHVCQLEVERLCKYNSDCPGQQVCGVDGECRDQCAGDKDCVSGQVCVTGTCAEPSELIDGKLVKGGQGASAGQPCSYSSDCADDLVCRAQGFCGVECNGAKDCAGGQKCENNKCVGESGKAGAAGASGSSGQGGAGQGGSGGAGSGAGGAAGQGGSGNAGGVSGQGGGGNGGSGGDAGQGGGGAGQGGSAAGGQGGEGGSAQAGQGGEGGQGGDAGAGGSAGAAGQGGGQGGSGGLCANNAQDSGESDIDCGGPCPACAPTKACGSDLDCQSLVCFAKVCLEPGCDDKVKNGNETGVDCGGGVCEPCPPGAVCLAGTDCGSGVCGVSGTCAVATCSDKVKNSDETAPDCGGSCPPCDAGSACKKSSDCSSEVCQGGACKQVYTLTVNLKGPGAGTVGSADGAISCPPTCQAKVAEGLPVKLTATPASGSTFGGWSSCPGLGTQCDLTMTGDLTVEASFNGSAPGQPVALPFTPSTAIVGAAVLAIDPSDGLLLGGRFSGTINFASGPLTSVGADGFVRVPSAGSTNARKMGGSGNEGVVAVAAHPSGDVLVVATNDAATTNLSFGGPPMPSCAAGSLILARYGAGDLLHKWSRCLGTGISARRALADKDGNLIVAASFSTSQSLDGISIQASKIDMVVARFSSTDGKALGAVVLGGAGDDKPLDLAQHSDGSLAVAGVCTGGLALQGGVTSAPLGNDDGCVIRLTPALIPVWAKQLGDTQDDQANGVGFDGEGNMIVAGRYRNSPDFESGKPQTAKGGTDIFLVWLDKSTAAIQQFKLFQTTKSETVVDLEVTAGGDIVFVGNYDDALSLGGSPLVGYGSPSMFVAKLGPQGEHLWSWGGPTGSIQGPVSIGQLAVDSKGVVHASGYSINTAGFGVGQARDWVVTLSP